MAVTLNDVVRIAARHKWDTVSDVVNVYYAQVTTVPGLGGDALFMQDVAEWLGLAYSEIQPQISARNLAIDINGYNVTDDAPLPAVSWGAGYDGGSGTGESLPPGNAALVLWRTGVKRTVGKTYLPPMTEGVQADGRITSGTFSAIESFIDAMRNNGAMGNGYGMTLGVYKRSGGVMAVITSASPSLVVAYQRRRRQGTGS